MKSKFDSALSAVLLLCAALVPVPARGQTCDEVIREEVVEETHCIGNSLWKVTRRKILCKTATGTMEQDVPIGDPVALYKPCNQPCEGARAGSVNTITRCINGFSRRVTTQIYFCPDGSTREVITEEETQQPCGPQAGGPPRPVTQGGVGGSGVTGVPPRVTPSEQVCQGSRPVRRYTTKSERRCVGGTWVYFIEETVECADGTKQVVKSSFNGGACTASDPPGQTGVPQVPSAPLSGGQVPVPPPAPVPGQPGPPGMSPPAPPGAPPDVKTLEKRVRELEQQVRDAARRAKHWNLLADRAARRGDQKDADFNRRIAKGFEDEEAKAKRELEEAKAALEAARGNARAPVVPPRVPAPGPTSPAPPPPPPPPPPSLDTPPTGPGPQRPGPQPPPAIPGGDPCSWERAAYASARDAYVTKDWRQEKYRDGYEENRAERLAQKAKEKYCDCLRKHFGGNLPEAVARFCRSVIELPAPPTFATPSSFLPPSAPTTPTFPPQFGPTQTPVLPPSQPTSPSQAPPVPVAATRTPMAPPPTPTSPLPPPGPSPTQVSGAPVQRCTLAGERRFRFRPIGGVLAHAAFVELAEQMRLRFLLTGVAPTAFELYWNAFQIQVLATYFNAASCTWTANGVGSFAGRQAVQWAVRNMVWRGHWMGEFHVGLGNTLPGGAIIYSMEEE